MQAVDLAALVGQMREQRMGMVQTRDQYVFCHTALLRFVRQLDTQQQEAPAPAAADGGS
jgi:protein tyrosine phosphatase